MALKEESFGINGNVPGAGDLIVPFVPHGG